MRTKSGFCFILGVLICGSVINLVQAQDMAPIKPTGNFYGLIIGESQYDNPKLMLDHPTRDAKRFRDILLARYTFEDKNVKLLLNATRQQIFSELYNLRKVVNGNDNLVIFYAGHGYWDDQSNQGYWWPKDAAVDEPSNWLSNSDLKEQIRGIKSAHTLLISDACFSGGIFKTRSAAEAIKSSSLNIQMLYKMPSRRAMTSGTLTTVPDESVFFSYLVKRMTENTEQFLPSQELFNSLKQAVINNSMVVPQDGVIGDSGDEGGDFIFVLKGNLASSTDAAAATGNSPADVTKVTRGVVAPTAEELSDHGKDNLSSKNYTDAISDFTSAIALDPQNAQAYNLRGKAYAGLKKYNLAISDYDKAIELKPVFANALCLRGAAKIEIHKSLEAIDDLSKAIEIDPRYVYAYNFRGFAELDVRKNDLALADFNKAMLLDVRLAGPYNGRGVIYLRQNKLEEAITDFNKAIELNPKYSSAWTNRGLVEIKKSKWDDARRDITMALQLDPKSYHVYNDLGMLDLALNDPAKAVTNFSKSMEINPKYYEALLNRSKAYLAKKDFGNALIDINAYLERFPKNTDAVELKAQIEKGK